MFCLPLLDANAGTATVYRFSNVDHELTQYLGWSFNQNEFYIDNYIDGGTIKVPTLEVAVLDKDKKELQVELIPARRHYSEKVALEIGHPWVLYSKTVLLRQCTFSVVMKIEDDALRQADSIRVRLVK
jgi:hypothetical protein